MIFRLLRNLRGDREVLVMAFEVWYFLAVLFFW